MSKLIFLSMFYAHLYTREGYANDLPDFIKPCPGLTNECLKKTVQATIPDFVKGIASIGLESLDPLYIDHVELTLPGNLKMKFDNGTLRGLRKCAVETISFENDEASLNLLCNVTIKGKYRARGHILIMTINGDGDAKIKTTNVGLHIKIKFHDVLRDGVTYYEIKEYDLKYKLGDKINYQLTNLFKGNPELSQVVLQFINENWKELSEEFSGPILSKLVELVLEVIKKFFMAFPKNEIIV